jgi:hypothetical protein
MRSLISILTARSALVAVAAFASGAAIAAAAGAFTGGAEQPAQGGPCADGCVSAFVAEPPSTPTAAPQPVAIATPEPPLRAATDAPAPIVPGAPAGSGAAPALPAPVNAAAPPAAAAPAGVASNGSGSGCTTNCGEPRFFCDGWSGGFCDDYRDKFTLQPVAFPSSGDPYSFDWLSTTAPGYWPGSLQGALTSLPSFTGDQEHFHTAVEDGAFGQALLRLQRPFDFAGREGHVHFDADLKVSERRYLRLTLSPDLTKRGSDDRSGDSLYPANALDIWFKGGFTGTLIRNGSCGDGYCFGNAFKVQPADSYFGTDNVRDHIDVHVTRSSVRIIVNGQEWVNRALPDIGFDRAYVYLSQVSYNPCKDDQCSSAEQIFHWDNVAFDGPLLARNGLTPTGQRDIVFNAYSATECSVRGVPAQASGPVQDYTWVTWVARLPDDGSAAGPADVACTYTFSSEGSDVVRGFEIVSAR